MADRYLREAERRYRSSPDDLNTMVAFAAALVRSGMPCGEIRTKLQPLVRFHRQARSAFLQMLPAGVSAFCNHCGQPLALNADGIPVDSRGARSPKRRFCRACMAIRARAGRRVRETVLKHNYCGRCGSIMRGGAHRCEMRLPDWVTGGDATLAGAVLAAQREAGSRSPHWSNWRRLL